MKVYIERHKQGYCLVDPNGWTINEGTPPRRATLYFRSKKEAKAYATDKGLSV